MAVFSYNSSHNSLNNIVRINQQVMCFQYVQNAPSLFRIGLRSNEKRTTQTAVKKRSSSFLISFSSIYFLTPFITYRLSYTHCPYLFREVAVILVVRVHGDSCFEVAFP